MKYNSKSPNRLNSNKKSKKDSDNLEEANHPTKKANSSLKINFSKKLKNVINNDKSDNENIEIKKLILILIIQKMKL